jgi:hypothetical protein
VFVPQRRAFDHLSVTIGVFSRIHISFLFFSFLSYKFAFAGDWLILGWFVLRLAVAGSTGSDHRAASEAQTACGTRAWIATDPASRDTQIPLDAARRMWWMDEAGHQVAIERKEHESQ